MALQILSSPSSPENVAESLREAIAKALPAAAIEVRATGAGHFEIRVVSKTFEGKPRVAQQQSVYGAIAHLMKGDAAPVHAIDKLETLPLRSR
jgi:acid stress-induced BolA-like protein IbaG/YrbA